MRGHAALARRAALLSTPLQRAAPASSKALPWEALQPCQKTMLLGSCAQIFHQKHAAESGSEKWICGNALFFRMNRILDIYFVGGFGTVQVRARCRVHGRS